MNTETKTKWTTRSAGNAGRFFIEDSRGNVIAEIPNTTSETERELFSLAPEMAEALREMLALWRDLGDSNPGFLGKLALQDYQRMNEAPIKARALLAKLSK